MAARKNTGYQQMTVGAFVLAGVLVLAAMVFTLGNPRGMFARQYRVYARMTHVGELQAGAPIRMAGIRVGNVEDVSLEEDGRDVLLLLAVNDTINLPKDSKVRVSTAGLVGDTFLEITRGHQSEYLPKTNEPSTAEEWTIQSDPPVDVKAVAEKVTAFVDQVGALVNHLTDVVGDSEFKANLKQTVSNVNTVTGHAAKLLENTGEIQQALQDAAINIRQITEQANLMVKKVDGAVDKGVHVIDGVKKAVDEIAKPENIATVNGLVADAGEAGKNVKELTADLRRSFAMVSPEKVGGMVDGAQNLVDKANKLADKADKITDQVGAVVATVQTKVDKLDMDAVGKAITNVGQSAEKFAAIFKEVDAKDVGETVKKVMGSLRNVAGLADEIMADPAKALALNKSVDRAVEAMFKDMHRRGVRTSDAMMLEIRDKWNAWRKQTYLPTPDYPNAGEAPFRRP